MIPFEIAIGNEGDFINEEKRRYDIRNRFKNNIKRNNIWKEFGSIPY